MAIDCKTVNNVEIQVENPYEEPPYVPELIRQQRKRIIDFTKILDCDELCDILTKLEIELRMKKIYNSNPNRSKHSIKLHMLYALKKEFSVCGDDALKVIQKYDFTSKGKVRKK